MFGDVTRKCLRIVYVFFSINSLMHNLYFRFIQKSSSLMSFSCFSKYFLHLLFLFMYFCHPLRHSFLLYYLYIPTLSFLRFSHLHSPSQGKHFYYLIALFISRIPTIYIVYLFFFPFWSSLLFIFYSATVSMFLYL